MRIATMKIPMLALLAAAAAAPLAAQNIYYEHRTGGYAMVGVGGGNFTVTCDSACGANKLGASDASLILGRHFGQRVRAELGFHYQSNRDSASNIFTAQLGAAAYVISNLYVRGGVTYHRLSVEQASGTYEGSGGPGFSVGAGYDLHLGRTFALTPFVNYASGSVSKISIAHIGGGTGTTGGTVKSLNFGVAASFIRGTYVCVNGAGQRIRVTRSNRTAATSCLLEVERRIGRPSGVKR
jgi:hypothetical protein